MPDNNILHFARFEFKYILPLDLRKEVESELGYFVDLDPFVASIADHKYAVRSLYFDDPDYTAFYDKIDGVHTRSKYRIRTYTLKRDDTVPRFLEIKGRYNNLVFKHRTPLENWRENITEERGDKLTLQTLANKNHSKVLDNFTFEYYRKNLRPVALVDYLRRPYISKYDPEFRLTLDEQLAGTITDTLFPSPQERRRNILPGYTVMEVKFRFHIPAWFHRIIQYYELRRVSVSKICEAMETLGIADNLS